MTALYLVPLVETITEYKDHTVTERVPAGCEEVVPGRVWKTLNPGGGVKLLSISDPLASLPKGAQQLTSAKGERLTAQTVGRVGNALGKNLDTTRHRDLSALLADLLIVDAEKPLIPVRTEGGREIRIRLVDETIVIPIPAGGAEITDNFNRASLGAGWTATAWYSGAPVAILDSIELGTTAPIGTDMYMGRHLTALSSADHYVQAEQTVADLNGRRFGLALRMDDNDAPSSCYQGEINDTDGEFAIWQVDHGYGRSKIASAATFDGNADGLLRFEANGSDLELFWKSASVLDVSDGTYTTDLYVGAWFNVNGDFARLDDFEASPLGGGGTDLALTPVSIPVTAVALARTVGGASVAVSPATVPVAPQVLGRTAGGVSIAASPATVPVAPVALAATHAASLTATPASVSVTPSALGVTPGGVNAAVSPASVPVTPVALTATHAVALTATPASVPVAPQVMGVTPGGASVALTPATIPVAPVVVVLSAAAALALSPPSVPVAGVALGVAPGGAGVAAAPVEIQILGVTPGVSTPGSQTIPLTPVSVTVAGSVVVSAPGGVNLGASPASVPLVAQALAAIAAVSLGASPVVVPVTPETPGVAPGAVSPGLSPATIVLVAQVLGVVTPQTGAPRQGLVAISVSRPHDIAHADASDTVAVSVGRGQVEVSP